MTGEQPGDDEIEDLDALVDEVADIFHIASGKIEDGTLTRREKKAVAIAGRCFQNYQSLMDLLEGAEEPEDS